MRLKSGMNWSERPRLRKNTPCRQGQRACYTGIMPDVREQRRVEQRLRASLPHLLGDDRESAQLRLWLMGNKSVDKKNRKPAKIRRPSPRMVEELIEESHRLREYAADLAAQMAALAEQMQHRRPKGKGQ